MQLEAIERRMWPGGWNTKPMLLQGDSLASVLAADAHRLASMRLSHLALGTKLAEVIALGAGTDWFRPSRDETFDVEVRRRRGFLTCPWAPAEFAKCPSGGGGRATANEFLVQNRRRRTALQGFEISVHLIRDHGFFGGPKTPFRIEPDDLADLLELRG